MHTGSLTPHQQARTALWLRRAFLSPGAARAQGERGVVGGALALLDAPAPAAAGKGLIALALAVRASPRFLAQALRGRLLPQVGRPAWPGAGVTLRAWSETWGMAVRAAAAAGGRLAWPGAGAALQGQGRAWGGPALPGAHAALHA